MARSKALSATEKALQARVNTATANLGADTGNVMRLKREGFAYGDGVTESFTAIVLGAAFENVYYDRPYDPEAGYVDPLCFAVGQRRDDLGPPDGHKHPQCARCDDCEMNEFGSALVGKGKACRNGRRVALVAVPDPEDLSTVDPSEVAILRLAPTSLKPYAGFETAVFRGLGKDPIQYITEFRTDQSVEYGKIETPKVVKMYDDEQLLSQLLAIDVQSILEDVGYSLEPEPYEPPKRASKKRSRLA